MDKKSPVAKTIKQVSQRIWDRDTQSLPWWERLGVQIIRIFYAVLRDLADGQLSLRAMSLVYTTIISMVPLLALSFSVLKGFGVHNQIEPALLGLLEPLGDQRFEIMGKIVGFVDNIKVGVLGAVGLALLLYSVIAMMHKIEKSFNYTWQITRGRTLSQRFSDYLSVILVGPLLIFLSVGITASIRSTETLEYLTTAPFISVVVQWSGLLIPYLIMAVGFTFIYIFIPNTRVSAKSAFIGGLVTAVTWKIMGWVFAAFIANSASQTAVYSAFASVIIFMIWLYLGWLMLLIGASIAFYHQNPQNILVRRDTVLLSNETREKLALNIIYLISKHFFYNKPPWNAEALANHLHLSVNAVADILEALKNTGFIVPLEQNHTGYYPARPLDQLLVAQVLNAIRKHGDAKGIQAHRITVDQPVLDITAKTESALDNSLEGLSMIDIINSDDS
jgi:membrane protein